MNWILDNKEWIFSGAGLSVIGGIWAVIKFLIIPRRDKKQTEINKTDNVVGAIINNNTVNITPSSVLEDNTGKATSTETKDTSNTLASIKDRIKILFIDDEKFMMVDILKEAGWVNTKRMKDVSNLEHPIILESHIIFVDINGVAKNLFKDQGIGLAGELKKKYPEKVIIIYSAESNGDRFHKTLREVDECISKNAEPYEFIGIVEEASQKIKI